MASHIQRLCKSLQVFITHPFSLEVLANPFIGQPKIPCLLDCMTISFNLSRSLGILVLAVKELLSFHKLFHVNEFVDQVEVNVNSVAIV